MRGIMEMKKVELHFHTDESSRCGKVPAKDGVRMYIEQGYAGLAVTDHFSEYACGKEGPWEDICSRFLEGWRLAKETAESAGSGFQVYLGMEIRFPHDENDFLVYGMTEEFFQKYPWIYEKELPDLYQIAEKEGLTIIQAHPFRSVCFPADPECLHGIEIFNGNPRHDSHNDLARALAEQAGLPGTAGSDFHQVQDLASCCVGFEKLPRGGQELAEAIRQGRFTREIFRGI